MGSVPENLKILLVEDAAVMRKIETSVLRKLGHTDVTQAENGAVARELFEEGESFDLIISDWNMPEMDGYELLKWVRARNSTADLPFIMATGQSEKTQERRARAAGVDGFIVKPFSPQELSARIDEVFGAAAPVAEPVATGPTPLADGKVRIRVAHIQITDHLVLGVLDYLIRQGDIVPQTYELETRCMPSWNPVRKSLEDGTVDAAFVLAPIAMELFAEEVPLNLVLLAHRGGSTFVRNRKGIYKKPYGDFFRNKSFFIPHMLSVHHVLAHAFFQGLGLSASLNKGADVNFEIIPPVQMPEQLALSPDASGFMVAEPLGTKTIAAGDADLQFLSSELWPGHPCCVVAARHELTREHESATHELVAHLIEAGKFLQQRPDIGASVAVDFLDPHKDLGLKAPVLKNVLTEEEGITTDNLFPSVAELDELQHYMHDVMRVGPLIDVRAFVDDRFARAALGEPTSAKPIDLRRLRGRIEGLLANASGNRGKTYKAKLELEGKYLAFEVGGLELGVDALKIREIVALEKIESAPNLPPGYLGILNLRGEVIPVADLRPIFNLEPVEFGRKACIVVFDVWGRAGHQNVGVVVDMVKEVLDITAADLRDTPYFGASIDTTHIIAFAETGGVVRVLLNMEQLLGFGPRGQQAA